MILVLRMGMLEKKYAIVLAFLALSVIDRGSYTKKNAESAFLFVPHMEGHYL